MPALVLGLGLVHASPAVTYFYVLVPRNLWAAVGMGLVGGPDCHFEYDHQLRPPSYGQVVAHRS